MCTISGEKVLVLVKQKDGWWKGEKDGQTGYFPSNFVCEGDIGPPPEHAPTPPVQTIPPPTPTNNNNNGATTQQQCIFDPDDVRNILRFNSILLSILFIPCVLNVRNLWSNLTDLR
eukprot:sb/3476662/